MSSTPRPSRFAILAAIPLLALAAACGGNGGTPAPAASGATASGPAATGGTSARPSSSPASSASGPLASATGPSGPASGSPAGGDHPDLAAAHVAVTPVVTGLDQPLWVTGDGTGRLFVVEQPGRIRIVANGAVQDPAFLDITDRVMAGGERGLLGLAFPAGFPATNPRLYVYYSGAGNGDQVLSEFSLGSGATDRADPASERVLLREPDPYPNHNGGWIGFDASGMLLLALGDGGSGGDPENRASDLGSPQGKILRIDPTRPSDGRQYGIPADNPFVGRPGARPEILHYGLRNPFRDAFDPATGDLWIGDVGQNAWEEVDVARAGSTGLDFGWRRWEGRHCYNPPSGCDPTGVTQPVAEYSHADGCSIIGGVVYHGAAIPALRGAYLFSDYCSGTLWAIDAALDTEQTPVVLLQTAASVSSVSTGDDGEVYLTDLGGKLLRLVPGP
jgi:glucose/arabinose dehydrogenase